MRPAHVPKVWFHSLAICLALGLFHTPDFAYGQRPIVLSNTLEASLSHPKIYVQLRNGSNTLSGPRMQVDYTQLLGAALPGMSAAPGAAEPETVTYFTAFLDTGASANVLSKTTLGNFGGLVEEHAKYHEFGLHGETVMGVSQPYTLLIANSDGSVRQEPKGFRVRNDATTFEVNNVDVNPMQASIIGEMNVIGMPIIKDVVVEIDPRPMQAGAEAMRDPSKLMQGGKVPSLFRAFAGLGGNVDMGELMGTIEKLGSGPGVRLLNSAPGKRNYDVVVPLQMRDYSRHNNPMDMGPRPNLAKNPVLAGIQCRRGKNRSTGDWLLDTGAASSLISTAQAKKLGLIGPEGEPLAKVAFQLPMSGIGGKQTVAQGFVVPVLRVKTTGRPLEYRNVHVLVHDVAAKLDDGKVVVLDGVFGNNLMLPSVGKITGGMPGASSTGPFERLWVDGPGSRLLLALSNKRR